MEINIFSLFKRIVHSIAFRPALIVVGFAFVPFLLVLLPNPELKGSFLGVLSITDPDSINVILAFIIGGVFTLTVFSYTMVMNVLNRSINNYSPRLVPLLLAEPHHQIILGVTSGTIIYSLILSIFIATDAPVKFPNLATALGIVFTICCIFLFIYFIHSVSQSIHINYILRKSYLNTKKNIKRWLDLQSHLVFAERKEMSGAYKITSRGCGYYNGLRIERLAKIAKDHDLTFKILVLRGDFVYEEQAFLEVSHRIDEKLETKVKNCFEINLSEPMDVAEVGFKHITEVAIKASSPAINDPGTSISSIDYLTQLFIHYLQLQPFNAYEEDKTVRIFFKTADLADLFFYLYREMIRYMKDDPVLKLRLKKSMQTLIETDTKNRLTKKIEQLMGVSYWE